MSLPEARREAARAPGESMTVQTGFQAPTMVIVRFAFEPVRVFASIVTV